MTVTVDGLSCFSIYNALGMKVKDELVNGGADLDLSDLPDGLYTAKATVNGENIEKKLLIVE